VKHQTSYINPATARPQLAILVDYDGTIARADVSDEYVRRAASREAWQALDAAYLEGRLGSRELLEAEARLLPSDASRLPDMTDIQVHDPAFAPFAAFANEAGVPVEVISDGLGFFVRPAIRSLGLSELPVFAAAIEFGGVEPRITFPDGHPTCLVCGTCKRQRVMAHRAMGRHVAFVGDGHSDRFAAWYADTVFARDHLADLCDEMGIRYQRWDDFRDVHAWLARALIGEPLATPVARPFICGPEVGRTT
jgi:HAD superfamily phosphoserine phosphatase-like hydrolase